MDFDIFVRGDVFSAGTTIGGTADSDILVGAQYADTLQGEAGGDLLIGAEGNDVLDGGAGFDRLVSGDGQDRLTGGTGGDILTGNAGHDTFAFAAGFGLDEIEDFTPGTDFIEFTTALFADATAVLAATVDDGNGNTVITVDAGNAITLQNVLKAELADEDFAFV